MLSNILVSFYPPFLLESRLKSCIQFSYPEVEVASLTLQVHHFLVVDVNLTVVWCCAVDVVFSLEVLLERSSDPSFMLSFRSVPEITIHLYHISVYQDLAIPK